MEKEVIGKIDRVNDKYKNADNVFSLIENDIKNSGSNHYSCGWLLKENGEVEHICNEK